MKTNEFESCKVGDFLYFGDSRDNYCSEYKDIEKFKIFRKFEVIKILKNDLVVLDLTRNTKHKIVKKTGLVRDTGWCYVKQPSQLKGKNLINCTRLFREINLVKVNDFIFVKLRCHPSEFVKSKVTEINEHEVIAVGENEVIYTFKRFVPWGEQRQLCEEYWSQYSESTYNEIQEEENFTKECKEIFHQRKQIIDEITNYRFNEDEVQSIIDHIKSLTKDKNKEDEDSTTFVLDKSISNAMEMISQLIENHNTLTNF